MYLRFCIFILGAEVTSTWLCDKNAVSLGSPGGRGHLGWAGPATWHWNVLEPPATNGSECRWRTPGPAGRRRGLGHVKETDGAHCHGHMAVAQRREQTPPRPSSGHGEHGLTTGSHARDGPRAEAYSRASRRTRGPSRVPGPRVGRGRNNPPGSCHLKP